MESKRVGHNWSDLAHTRGHEGGAFLSGISALIKMTPGQSKSLQARTQQKDYEPGSRPSPDDRVLIVDECPLSSSVPGT